MSRAVMRALLTMLIKVNAGLSLNARAIAAIFPQLIGASVVRRRPSTSGYHHVTRSCRAFCHRPSGAGRRSDLSPRGLLWLLRAAAASAALRHLLSAAGHSAAIPELRRNRDGFAQPAHRASHAGAL